ncbi:MAG: hypothetical protein E7315_04020 [Clostridiales bacterium]|nr:hypothetical protein [Clostridiales bacterium]
MNISVKKDYTKEGLLYGLLFIGIGVAAAAITFFWGLILMMFGIKDASSSWIVAAVMIPVSILFYHSMIYKIGYKDSLEGKYNKKRIYVAALTVFIFQILVAVLAINEFSNTMEQGTWYRIAGFIFAQYGYFFNKFPDFMPELFVIPAFIEAVVMIISYGMSEKTEKKDHAMDKAAVDFRASLEKEQYGRDDIPAGERASRSESLRNENADADK